MNLLFPMPSCHIDAVARDVPEHLYITVRGTATTAHVKQDQDAAVVAELARRFTALVRTCSISGCTTADAHPDSELAAWLAKARACGVRAIATLAAEIKQDAAAVRSALAMPRSSAQSRRPDQPAEATQAVELRPRQP